MCKIWLPSRLAFARYKCKDRARRTLEVHVCEHEHGELRERRDVARDRAAELVAAEVELLERRRERREQSQRLGKRRPCARNSRLNFGVCGLIAQTAGDAPSRPHAPIFNSFRLVSEPHSAGMPPVNECGVR